MIRRDPSEKRFHAQQSMGTVFSISDKSLRNINVTVGQNPQGTTFFAFWDLLC